ncbi:MAG: TldD/PmbA family protein [Sulfolobales archaeon]
MSNELLSINENLMSDLRNRYDESAVQINEVNNVMIKIVNNEISLKHSQTSYIVSLYLVKDRRIFVLESSTSSINDIRNLTERVRNYANVVQESELYAPLPEPKSYKPLNNLVDDRVRTYIDSPAQLCELMINSAINEGAKRVSGTLKLSILSKALTTSKGFEGFEQGSEVVAYLRAFKDDYSGHWAYGSRSIDLRLIEDVGRRAAQYATLTKNSVEVPPGRYDVILSPLVVGNLMELVTTMASAFYVLSGFSIFMGKHVGDKVASEDLTLADVPRDVELSGSTAFDDEGVETYNKEIVGKGLLKTLLHNFKTAIKFNTSSTGNAGWISPKPWSISIMPGNSSDDEMIREVRNGLLITNNWYTRLQNYVEGTFSTVSRDAVFYIRNGEIIGVTNRVRIADNLNRFLNNISLVGKDSYLIKWWEVTVPSKVPYMMVKDINITKPFD